MDKLGVITIMWGKSFAVVVLLLLVVPMAFSITINPIEYKIDSPQKGKDYAIILTLINPDVNTYEVNAEIPLESIYMKDNIKISPETVILDPNQKKNIKLNVKIPEDISPQRHLIYVDFKTLDQRIGRFKLEFTIEGEQNKEILIKNVEVKGEDIDSPIEFKIAIENKGNVITEVTPNIIIKKDEQNFESFGSQAKVKIMPKITQNLTLMYPAEKLSTAGVYSYDVQAKFEDKNTNTFSGTFSLKEIKKGEKKEFTIKKGETFKYPVKIINDNDKFTFYKIEYSVPQADLRNIYQGDLRQPEKEIVLEIDTNSIRSGDYDLIIKTYTGTKLENLKKEEIVIKIKSDINYLNMLAIAFISIGGLISLFLIIKSITNYVSKNRDPYSSRLSLVEKELQRLTHSLHSSENDFTILSQDIGRFVNGANNWLDNNTSDIEGRFR